MHGRKWNRAFQERRGQRQPSSSHYRKRSRSPPRPSQRRSPYRPSKRPNSPHYSLERRYSPSHYIEKHRPPSYLDRSRSPVYRFGRNKSPPHSLGRSRSPGYYPEPGRNKAPVHYRQRTRSPSPPCLEGNVAASAQYVEKSQPTSHYLQRSESPAHYVARNKSPSYNLWRNQSPTYNLERSKSPFYHSEQNQSPPPYLRRSQSPAYSPSYNLDRDESPNLTHCLEKNEIPPDYLRRSQSPGFDFGRNKSPSQYLEKSKSPSPENNQSPANYYRETESSDHYFETGNSSDRYFEIRNSPLHSLERTEFPTYNIEANASPTPYSRRSMSPSPDISRSESLAENIERNDDYPYQYSRSSKSPQYFGGESHSPYPGMGFDEPSAYSDHDSDHNASPPNSMDTDDSEHYQFDDQQHDNTQFTSQGSSKKAVFRGAPLKFSMDNPKNRRHSITIKIKSIEEVDKIPNWRMTAIRLTGGAHRKVTSLKRKGVPYVEAKRTIVKEIFLKKRKKQMISFSQRHVKGKRPFKQKAESVSVVHEGFPRIQLGIGKLKMIEEAILHAHEHRPKNGPQVCFRKCQCKSGFLLVRCLDKQSADWVRQVVPQLQPWEGAVLKVQSKNSAVPKPVKCMVFVPDENGERLSSDVFLDQLRISNPGLNSHLWMAVGKTAEGNGVLWTLHMDVESLNLLEKVDMQPIFGQGRLKFTLHSAVV